jgi:hypothetical protein
VVDAQHAHSRLAAYTTDGRREELIH